MSEPRQESQNYDARGGSAEQSCFGKRRAIGNGRMLRISLPLVAFALAAAACSDTDDPTDPRDAGAQADAASGDAAPADATTGDATAGDATTGDATANADAAIPSDGGPPACEDPGAYVGDPSWPLALTSADDSALCVFPGQYDDPKAAIGTKRKLHISTGSYQVPQTAADAPFRIPACFDYAGAPSIGEGTVDAERGEDFPDNVERYMITAEHPLSDGGYLFLRLRLNLDETELDLSSPVTRYGAIAAAQCVSRECSDKSDVVYTPCSMIPRLCDRLEFADGNADIEQFHWAGQVGAGFAIPLRVRGVFRGQAFDISAYEQMTMGYGHHAFARELYLFFDAPIDGVCGLHFPEVSEFGEIPNVELIDCAADRIGTSAVTGREHLFNGACPN